MRNFISCLEQHAVKKPAEIAITTEASSMSYQQLWVETEKIKDWLLDANIGCLGFQLDNGLTWLLLDIAAVKAGIRLITLPTFFSEQQIKHVVEDASVDMLVSENPQKFAGEWKRQEFELADNLYCYQRSIAQPLLETACKITYTSGSTGHPKGVCLPLTHIDQVALSVLKVMSEVEIAHHLCVLPLATLLENVAGLYAPLMKGITVSVPSLNTVGLSGSSLDIGKFVAVLNDYKPDSLILVPQLLTALITLNEMGMLNHQKYQFIAVGGGRISEHLLETAKTQGLPVYQGYGLSEVCSVASLNVPGLSRQGSVGKPLPHVQIRVNAAGEIEIKGPSFTGYLGDKVRLQAWFATGDLGHFDTDGFLYINGRIKHMFITSFGRNVNPEWVESALTQQPAIAQALVVGEGRSHNLALIWTRFPQTDEEISVLINKANQELPDYAQVHDFIVMQVGLDSSLMTENGRLKRHEVIVKYEATIADAYISCQCSFSENSLPVMSDTPSKFC